MSSHASAAVFHLAQELTADEFRLLALISEISTEYTEPLNIRALRRDFAASDPDLYLHIKGMKAK